MKKYLNISLVYAIAAMAGGVFYREFTKFQGYTGVTALGKVHAHLFLLGMLVFLVAALYAARYDLETVKTFRAFLWTYNLGVPLTAVMLLVRGVTQVMGMNLSAAADASISGIAGIGHILTGTGIILLILSLKAGGEINHESTAVGNVYRCLQAVRSIFQEEPSMHFFHKIVRNVKAQAGAFDIFRIGSAFEFFF